MGESAITVHSLHEMAVSMSHALDLDVAAAREKNRSEQAPSPSGEDWLRQVEIALRDHLRGQATRLRLVRASGGVIIEGEAPTFYAKQLAQHFVHHHGKLPVVANQIHVTWTRGSAPDSANAHHGYNR